VKTDVHRIDAADTADNQREDQHAAEEAVEVADSCIDWQPSRLVLLGVDLTFSLKGVTIQADNKVSVRLRGQEKSLPSYCKDMMPMTKGKGDGAKSGICF
jgi:hypothetical protein